ncbi:MAG: radical SAM protein [Eggerthellaceae bacterium]|nr:radical SAM protein [Eggerthellaceae bacterium]
MDKNIIIPEECELCPRRCRAKRAQGRKGLCGANDSLQVARAALHEWEEPPLSAKAGSGAVFFSHCPLKCVYCQNASIAHDGFGEVISAERLSEIYLELQEQEAANINLVTASHYLPWVLYSLERAKQHGLVLPIVWNTSGYECLESIDALDGFVDIYLSDFKYAPHAVSDAAQRYSQAPDYFDVATQALDAMVKQIGAPVFDAEGSLKRGVVVRHLLLPKRLDDSKYVIDYLWQRYGNTVLYSVMNQYTPMAEFEKHPELNQVPRDEDYEELLDYMDELGMEDYFWQEGGAQTESFIPPFDSTGVK